MGLDGVEFLMAVEKAFDIAISDQDAQHLSTPGMLADYLEKRLAEGPDVCIEQRAFHRLRRAAMDVLGQPRLAVTPSAEWAALLPRKGRWRIWRQLRTATNIEQWPTMYWWGSHPVGQKNVEDTVRYLAAYGAAGLMDADAVWSRSRIELTVTRLMYEQLGIEKFRWDDRFVQELRIA